MPDSAPGSPLSPPHMSPRGADDFRDAPSTPDSFDRPSPAFAQGSRTGSPLGPPVLGALPSVAPLDPAALMSASSSLPSTPITPNTPGGDAKPKKSNPLSDLIDTEKHYVDQLAGIIRRVASAWSRSNLPPHELDTMFRSVEAVYKANRGLLNKLKEIGQNPKALGDLLMRWIGDLEAPYTTYCGKFCAGFDYWEPVTSNAKVKPILADFSLKYPPPTSLISTPDTPIWTLDALFMLPKLRIKYYKKLYTRLLKSSVPGRTDYNLLVGACQTLDGLLDTLNARELINVGEIDTQKPLPPVLGEDEVVIDHREQRDSAPHAPPGSSDTDPIHSESSSAAGSSVLGDRSSQDTATTSVSRGSAHTMSMPISDLERRLSAERTLDIFSMKPKIVKLQMTPPNLTFKRELRLSMDVVIRVTPRATGIEVTHRRGHIFLLSDLFLVCERMTPEERDVGGSEGPDMWLCYPPLAGKVLRVSDYGPDTIEVAIMRKEFFYIQAESPQAKDFIYNEFKDCIDFASSVTISKQPAPPMPPLPNFANNNGGPPPMGDPRNGGHSLPGSNNASPHSSLPSPPGPLPNHFIDSRSQSPNSFEEHRSPPPLQRGPSLGGPSNMPANFGPGQVMAPSRSGSLAGSYQGGPPRPPGPGEIMPPQPGAPFPPGGRGPSLPSGPGQNRPGLPPNPSGFPPNDFSRRPPSDSNVTYSASSSQRSLQSQYDSPPMSAPPGPMPGRGQNGFPQGAPPMGGPSMGGPSMGGPPMGGPPMGGPYVGGPPPMAMGMGYNGGPMGGPPRDPYGLAPPQARALLPSANNDRIKSGLDLGGGSFADQSPPGSPEEAPRELDGPVTSSISAQMKCKVFLKQQHAQWKSLGAAKLKLYVQSPTNIKQLVVEADDKASTILISTIVLTDGVERVGKTGVAIELSDKGARTGIVYMIQLRNEKSAGGLYDSLLAGSDRAAV